MKRNSYNTSKSDRDVYYHTLDNFFTLRSLTGKAPDTVESLLARRPEFYAAGVTLEQFSWVSPRRKPGQDRGKPGQIRTVRPPTLETPLRPPCSWESWVFTTRVLRLTGVYTCNVEGVCGAGIRPPLASRCASGLLNYSYRRAHRYK
eukprot:489604-Prorocentrum_minimum.AAC.2